jgi:hypothetical protein
MEFGGACRIIPEDIRKKSCGGATCILVMTGQRLDGKAPLVKVLKATNASAADIGDAMLVSVDFPTLGCWQITGKYKGAELSFVVWLAP